MTEKCLILKNIVFCVVVFFCHSVHRTMDIDILPFRTSWKQKKCISIIRHLLREHFNISFSLGEKSDRKVSHSENQNVHSLQ